MRQYAKDLWSQNSNPAPLNNGMIELLPQIKTGGKVGAKKRD